MTDGVYVTVPVEVAERQARERAQLVAFVRGIHGAAPGGFGTHTTRCKALDLLRELGELPPA